jgi:hypothetical protein
MQLLRFHIFTIVQVAETRCLLYADAEKRKIPMENVVKRHIGLMQYTLQTIEHVLADITPEQAASRYDADWSIVHIICHLRDFDRIFRDRARLIVEQDNPALIPVDHEELAASYHQENLTDALAQLRASREETVAFFQTVTLEQWSRTATHPHYGTWSLLDSLTQIGTHDANHIEQITRIIREH